MHPRIRYARDSLTSARLVSQGVIHVVIAEDEADPRARARGARKGGGDARRADARAWRARPRPPTKLVGAVAARSWELGISQEIPCQAALAVSACWIQTCHAVMMRLLWRLRSGYMYSTARIKCGPLSSSKGSHDRFNQVHPLAQLQPVRRISLKKYLHPAASDPTDVSCWECSAAQCVQFT